MCCDNPSLMEVFQGDVWVGRVCQNCGRWAA